MDCWSIQCNTRSLGCGRMSSESTLVSSRVMRRLRCEIRTGARLAGAAGCVEYVHITAIATLAQRDDVAAGRTRSELGRATQNDTTPLESVCQSIHAAHQCLDRSGDDVVVHACAVAFLAAVFAVDFDEGAGGGGAAFVEAYGAFFETADLQV